MYRELSAPLNCQLEVTTACNNKCLHCYNYWRGSSKKDVSLSLESARNIMHELAKAKVFEVTFTGGEPLLNFHVLTACLEAANESGIIPCLNSVLKPFDRRKARTLKALGLADVMVSVLGPDARLHDSITQKEGSFDETTTGIKIAQDAGMRVYVSMVVSKQNLYALRETACFVSSLGIKTFLATKACHPGGCTDFSNLALDNDQLTEYLETLVEVHGEMGMNCGYLSPYPKCAIAGIKGVKDLGIRRCTAGVSTCTISSNGGIRACSSLDFEYGNILTESFAGIWQRMHEWRKAVFLPQSCRTCKLLYVCGGGCRMEAKMYSGGDLCAMDPYAKPECIAEAVELHEASVKNEETVTADTQFQLRDFRWRHESFGAVVMANDPSQISLLDPVGFSVLKQFAPGHTYRPYDQRINWDGVNVIAFCSSLVNNGLATLLVA